MDNDREETIRQRAYAIWLEEGSPEGKHEEHWARAEREVAIKDDAQPAAKTPPGAPPPELENTLA